MRSIAGLTIAGVWLSVIAVLGLILSFAVGNSDFYYVLVGAFLPPILVVPVFGFRIAPGATTRSSTARPVIALATTTVLACGLVIALALGLVLAVGGGDLSALWVVIPAYFYGIVVFGIPGLILALPSAYLWVRALRWTFRGSYPSRKRQVDAVPSEDGAMGRG